MTVSRIVKRVNTSVTSPIPAKNVMMGAQVATKISILMRSIVMFVWIITIWTNKWTASTSSACQASSLMGKIVKDALMDVLIATLTPTTTKSDVPIVIATTHGIGTVNV